MTGEPEFPPMMSAEETKFSGVERSKLCGGREPPVRQVPVTPRPVGIVVVVHPIEGRVNGSHGPVVLVVLHHPVCDAEGEGGVRGHVGPVDVEEGPAQGAGDLGFLSGHGGLDLLGRSQNLAMGRTMRIAGSSMERPPVARAAAVEAESASDRAAP